ncbi:MAG: 4'-phosphopantetheinyl transferase superfamily protein [Candidatus Amulumruptor sp.]|nr:4'-phosphopantetheinyl transferase superfamily protein [Candidatus Amulumruptor sp.]
MSGIIGIESPLAGIELWLLPLDGRGRAAEREAVDRLFRELLGTVEGHRPYGAPFAVGRDDVAVSVSHGAGYALLALSHDPAVRPGVDIEDPCREGQLRRIASRFVSAADDPSLTPCEIWTAKEAAYKAFGRRGLPLLDIRVGREAVEAPGLCARVAWTCIAGAAVIAIAVRR